MLVLFIVAAVRGFIQRKADIAIFFAVSLLGVFLFFQVWEVANRYLYPYILFLVPVALYGMEFLFTQGRALFLKPGEMKASPDAAEDPAGDAVLAPSEPITTRRGVDALGR